MVRLGGDVNQLEYHIGFQQGGVGNLLKRSFYLGWCALVNKAIESVGILAEINKCHIADIVTTSIECRRRQKQQANQDE